MAKRNSKQHISGINGKRYRHHQQQRCGSSGIKLSKWRRIASKVA